MSTIPFMSYTQKIYSVYIFAEDIVNVLKTDEIKKLLIEHKFIALERFIEKHLEFRNLFNQQQSFLNKFKDTQRKKILEEYPITVINQSFSIICSLFESFLIESLEAIFSTKKETLLSISEKKEIKLDELIKKESLSDAISYFKEKTFRAFIMASTEDQFKKYFEKMKFNISEFFDMSSFPKNVQKKYANWDLDKLSEIFKERHKIVHEQKTPLKTLRDLSLRKGFFDKIIMNISKAIHEKFSIAYDINITLPFSIKGN